ncbi:MAG TPA: CBS domain-containing protein [Frankiaceae bacterium]|nr:CBS domain-containing protein [Frankiaceae bacterium]
MKVRDVMSRGVVSATPATTFKEAVDLMVAHDVGALPVLDDLGRVIGIVSEADLLAKAGYAGPPRRALLALVDFVDGDDASWRKAHARTVGDVMTTRPHTLRPDQDIAVAARMLVRAGHKRAPVVDDTGLLVGVVTRQDLLGAYARPDETIAADVTSALADPTRTPEGNTARARVRDGVVTLTGSVTDELDRRVVASVTWRVPGVVDVVDELTVRQAVPVL